MSRAASAVDTAPVSGLPVVEQPLASSIPGLLRAVSCLLVREADGVYSVLQGGVLPRAGGAFDVVAESDAARVEADHVETLEDAGLRIVREK